MTIQVRSNEPKATPDTSQAAEGQAAVSEKEPRSAPAEQAEQKESSESETEETEGKEREENETESGDESDSDETEKEGEKATPKKKGGFQRRIDKLNARYAQTAQELEYWKSQAMKVAGSDKAPAPKNDPKPADATAGKPNPENYDTHAEFVEALTDWKTESKLREREAKAERAKLESEEQKQIRAHVERVNSFKASAEDFDEVLSDVGDIPVSPAVREIILSSDNGPELMYELAKNREEYARICKLSPLSAAREMGRLETRIAARAASDKKPEPKKITNAPKPLEPVKAGGKGSASKSIFDPNLSQKEYERLRAEQSKRRQG